MKPRQTAGAKRLVPAVAGGLLVFAAGTGLALALLPEWSSAAVSQERFFRTHVRLSLDMLRTRHRERLLFQAYLEAKQSFVIDNTNHGFFFHIGPPADFGKFQFAVTAKINAEFFKHFNRSWILTYDFCDGNLLFLIR